MTSASAVADLRRHDLLVAIIVWCIALATFVESWHLTFGLELPGIEADKAWLVAPGVFPLVLSAGLLIMFAIVFWVSLKEGNFDGYFSSSRLVEFLSDRESLALLTQISLLCLFVFGLLGRVHFFAAAAIYLFTSMFAARAARWYLLVVIATAFSATVTYLFGVVMKIPLP